MQAHICIFYYFSTLIWHRWLKSFLMNINDLFILYDQYHGWWLGDATAMQAATMVFFFIDLVIQECSGPWFNIKMTLYQYRKSHCGDKTILQPSYLHNGFSHTGKTSLYWIGALFSASEGFIFFKYILYFLPTWSRKISQHFERP